jgi:hypothetical protein
MANYNSQLFQYALLLQANTSANMSVTTPGGASGIAVIPNMNYTGFAYFLALSNPRSVTMAINWYTAAGTLISTSTGTATADLVTLWSIISVSATAPSTAAYASLTATVLSPIATEQHLMTTALFAITSQFPASFFIPGAGPGGVHVVRTLTYNADGSLAAAS